MKEIRDLVVRRLVMKDTRVVHLVVRRLVRGDKSILFVNKCGKHCIEGKGILLRMTSDYEQVTCKRCNHISSMDPW